MSTKQAVALLRRFNHWRRWDGEFGQNPPPMPDPAQIGIAIDTVCAALSSKKKTK